MREDRRWRKEEREWIQGDEREETLTQPHSQEASSNGRQRGSKQRDADAQLLFFCLLLKSGGSNNTSG